MSRHSDPADEFARHVLRSAEPDSEDRRFAEARLNAAIAASASRKPGRHLRVASVAVAGVVLAAVVLASVVLSPPRPATASLEEIASATEASAVELILGDEFVYVDHSLRSLTVVPSDALGDVNYAGETLVYLSSLRREVWYSGDGSQQVRTTVESPEFFSAAEREAYYAAGLDERERVGETFTQSFPNAEAVVWPSDPDQLDAAIKDAAVSGRGLSDEVEYLDVALDAIWESPAAPKVRAEAFRLISRLPILEVVDEAEDETVTFQTQYLLNEIETEHRFTISKDGDLIRETATVLSDASDLGLPEGSILHETQIRDRRIVTSLHQPMFAPQPGP